MFKGLARLVPGTELNLTHAHQQSTTKRTGSVHKTNCKGRTVTVTQVSLWKHQDCAAITGSATEVGQNETPAQNHVNKSCGGNPSQHLWRSGSVYSLMTRVTSTKVPQNIQLDIFPTANQPGLNDDFSNLLSW